MAQQKDRIRVHIEGREYAVVGGAFQDMLAAVKQVSGRRFVGDLKVWQLPGSLDEIQRQLDISGFQLEGGKPVPASDRPQTDRPTGDRIRVLVEGRLLAVTGGAFQDMLAAVKNLPGRRFNGDTKTWEIPGQAAVVKGMIQAAGFDLEGAEDLSAGPAPPMEPPDFGQPAPPPPPFEPPDFFDGDDLPPFEPPDWWDGEEPPPLFEDEPYPGEPPEPRRPSGPAAPAGGDRIRLRLGEMALAVSGGSFKEMLEVVKQIPGRRFDPDEKVWLIPGDIDLETVQQAVRAAGFVLAEDTA